jgi:glycosyltransferase involved in cell wall biosynthesis
VDLLGKVDQPALLALYQGASAVIVTSRYEGFGFPALESMACGTPLVAFDNSALPEVIGDGGALVGDGDVAGMTAELDRVLSDQSHSRELSRRGLLRSQSFNWATAAERHRDIYFEAVEVWRRDAAPGGKRRDRQ